jgi:hypothetical protein
LAVILARVRRRPVIVHTSWPRGHHRGQRAG